MKNPNTSPCAKPGLNRRKFLAVSTAATAFMFLPRHVLGMRGAPSPNSKLNIAGIGIGSQGASDLECVNAENIVALCDVDWDYAANTFKTYPKAKRYKDFREMLDKERNIDAVVVGTPVPETSTTYLLQNFRSG